MTKYRLILCCFFFGIIVLGRTLVLGQVTPASTPTETSRFEEQLVHFGDVIDVDFVGGFEYDWRGTLTPDGYLDGLDGFGEPVYALCRGEAEIAADVAKAYGKILRDPKVAVRIIDRSNRAVVRLDGAVKTPARFRLLRMVKLRELLVIVGGLTDDTSGEISIFRPRNLSCQAKVLPNDRPSSQPQGNGSQTIIIKISDLLSWDGTVNIQILSGDLIDVSRAVPVYVIGAVNSPRPIYSRSQTTILRAIASAGGLTKDADGGKISIFRRNGTETTVFDTDLGKIKRGELIDEVLKPFDIIDVATKGGGKRKYPPVIPISENSDRRKQELPLRVID